MSSALRDLPTQQRFEELTAGVQTDQYSPNSGIAPIHWFQAFQDPLLVLVLALHVQAQNGDGEITLSARECASVLRISRNTVLAKRKLLHHRQIMTSEPGRRRGQRQCCRISWRSLNAAVSGTEVTQDWATCVEKVDQDWATCVEKVDQDWATSVEIPTVFAAASLFSFLARSSKASWPPAEENPQPDPPEPKALEREIRERAGELSIGNETISPQTVKNIAREIERLGPDPFAREKVLKIFSNKCRAVWEHPGRAKTWGLLFTTVHDAVVFYLTQQSETPAPRKPPEKIAENPAEVKFWKGELAAVAARKGRW